MPVQVLRRRFTVKEYYQMAQAGILSEDDRVELIEGEIIEMAPVGRRHATSVRRVIRLFSRRVGRRAIVDIQDPIHLGEHSEPQPDAVLLRPRLDLYASGHPQPEDILLLIEVADTTASYDREIKIPLYAQAGIAEVWLVDLEGDAIEVYRQPGPEGYRQVQIVRRGEALAPEALPDLMLRAEDILGPQN
jgi:Uma2 family endonuclease